MRISHMEVTRQVPVQTGLWVAEQIRQGIQDMRILDLSRMLVAGLIEEHYDPQLAAICELKVISRFVMSHIRYTRDPYGVELVYGPMAQVDRIAPVIDKDKGILITRTFAEDCDGFSVFTGALCAAVGHVVRVMLVGYRNTTGWNHIFIQARIPGYDWVTLDTSMKKKARYYLQFVDRVYTIPVNETPL